MRIQIVLWYKLISIRALLSCFCFCLVYFNIQCKANESLDPQHDTSFVEHNGNTNSRATEQEDSPRFHDRQTLRQLHSQQPDWRLSKGVKQRQQIHLCLLRVRLQLHQGHSNQIKTQIRTSGSLQKSLQMVRIKRVQTKTASNGQRDIKRRRGLHQRPKHWIAVHRTWETLRASREGCANIQIVL